MGRSIVHLGISTGNVATESMYEDKAVKNIKDKHFEITKER